MLTALELDIMKAVWRRPPITVRGVQEAIRPSRQLAYTTVLTVMDRLHQKGVLSRKLESRTHLYEPAVSFMEARDEALQTLIDSFFGGSREKLFEFLVRDAEEVPANGHAAQSSSLDETLL